MCRPLPVRNYLQGLPLRDKFVREPVSLVVTLNYIVQVVLMQACIEVKKYRAKKKERLAFQTAVEAGKSLTRARIKLQQDFNEPSKASDKVSFQLCTRSIRMPLRRVDDLDLRG